MSKVNKHENQIIDLIKEQFFKLNQRYIEESIDGYNHWENHIKFVVEHALELANQFNADREIVELGALLHDICLVANVGTKADHHTNGAIIAEKMLKQHKYPEDKLRRVLNCILNHRSSARATTNEELCVADADIMAHFDNMDMILNNINRLDRNQNDVISRCEKDYNDMSVRTKDSFKPRYDKFMKELNRRLKALWKQ